MSRLSIKRTAQQSLGRKDTDDHETIKNDTPKAPTMEEDSTRGSRKNQKVQSIEDSNQTDVERRSLRVKLRDVQRKL